MKTYTICGSMRFEKEMRKIAYELETVQGYNVLQCVYNDSDAVPTQLQREYLRKAHFLKIDLSDGIYVVNIGGYVGTSTEEEIAYALKHGKQVLYHCGDAEGRKEICSEN